MNKKPSEFISIFNDVLGPVMRGPSSSHTAGSHRIAHMARNLLGDTPTKAEFTFGKNRSLALVYREQRVDSALAAGLMDWKITDTRFFDAVKSAREKGLDIVFKEGILKEKHPNALHIKLRSKKGSHLYLKAKSIGGGAIRFTSINGWPIHIDGKSHVLLIEGRRKNRLKILKFFDSESNIEIAQQNKGERIFLFFKKDSGFDKKTLECFCDKMKSVKTWKCPPLFFTKQGRELFVKAEEIIEMAGKSNKTLGQLAVDYESKLLGFTPRRIKDEMKRRYHMMEDSVEKGLKSINVSMELLSPSAEKIMKQEQQKRLLVGGIHTRAASRAMAVMHTANSGGIVCAAPTGGSAGVVPGVAVTLHRDFNLDISTLSRALFAAGAVGLIISRRATFAAEEAGCQAEIGAAGAMAAALVVESAGGSAKQALDAASIALQNTMGSVCDLVQGRCEIPCHTRNAVAASSAFVCADLIMGGYENPISLDDAIDAMKSVGKMLPSELRCTSKGGIAVTPSAVSLPKIK